MFLSPRRVLSGEGCQFNVRIGTCNGCLDRGDGVGFVVLDTDQYGACRDDMGKDLCAFNQLVGLALHERIVGGDIGLALCAINEQRLDGALRARVQFHRRGKARAAHAGNTGFSNPLYQCDGIECTPVVRADSVKATMLTIGLDHNALIF